MIYAAHFETMNGLISFLTENCCKGAPGKSAGRKPVRTGRAKVPA